MQYHYPLGMASLEIPVNDPLEASCFGIEDRLRLVGIGDDTWYQLPRKQQYEKLADVIGNTRLQTVAEITSGTVLAKRECDNPSGSHYDRAYLATLQELEAGGYIQPGDELRDISSGSAGISLAMLGQLLNYKIRITVPDELPTSRIFPMEFFGAQTVRSGSGYIKQTSIFQRTEIKDLADKGWERTRAADPNMRAILLNSGNQRICYINHSENLASPRAFQAIGDELVREVHDPPEAIVLAMGNWTTIAGISPSIRAAWPSTRLIGFEGESTTIHDNYGTTVSGIPLRFRDEGLLDEMVIVQNEERDAMDEVVNADRPLEEQIGHTSLMGLVVAEKLTIAKPGATVSTIWYDHKLRY
jgi:cysteine synthase A